MVCIGHLLVHFELSKHPVVAYLPTFSVLIFFVLSGFLIAYTSDKKTASYGFGNYMADRFGRIYTVLAPVLVFTGLLMFLYAPEKLLVLKSVTGSLFSSLFLLYDHPLLSYHVADPYLGTDLTAYFFAGNLPLWSLCVEWWMYVLFGLVFYKRIRNLRMPHLVLGAIAISYAGGYLILEGRAGHAISAIWLSGALIYYLMKRTQAPGALRYLILPLLTLTVLCLFFAQAYTIFAFILFFSITVSAFQTTSSKSGLKVFGAFYGLAAFSYSLYLLHYPIMLWTDTFGLGPEMAFVVAFLFSNVLAYLFYLLFERHHRKLSKWVKGLLSRRPRPSVIRSR